MHHRELWQACREITWQKGQGVITAEQAKEQLEAVTLEYEDGCEQLEIFEKSGAAGATA